MRGRSMKPLQFLPNLCKVVAIHCTAIKSACIADTYVANDLINKYAKCKDLFTSIKLFEEMTYRDTSSWNTMITCYVNSRNLVSAWKVLNYMKKNGFQLDGYTFGSILKGVAISGEVLYGQQVHSDIVKMGLCNNVYAVSSLLDMYAKCGRVENASMVFEYMLERNIVSWNALIAGYADVGDFKCCFELFKAMEMEGLIVNDASFVPLLTLLDTIELVRQFHGKIMILGLEFEVTLLNAMISAYSACGCIEDSIKVFLSADGYRDLVTWNSMLAAYLQNHLKQCGCNFLLEMQRLRLNLDTYSYSTIISGCVEHGKSLHCLVIKNGLDNSTAVSNALISMYLNSKSCDEENAVKVFEHMDLKDIVSWNSILTSLSQYGHIEHALKLFYQMHLQDLDIDEFTLAAVLRSCSNLAMLVVGRHIHVIVLKSGFEVNEFVASAMIFMYSKCGLIEDAWKSFDASRKCSSITWNSIIFTYAAHGQCTTALNLFDLMIKKQVNVDHITFVAAITACSHVGLVEEGLNYLWSMEPKYGVVPRMENFACAVDLLGRAQRLIEAKELITGMPFEPDAMVWKTLLGACRACRDIELATRVASHLLELEPGDHCTYVLLSEMYGHLKKWDEKAGVKRLMRQNGVKKIPGWSWIELHNNVHAFNAEDHSHPNCQEIYQTSNLLMTEIKNSNYDITLEGPLDDIDFLGCYIKEKQSILFT